MAKDQTGDQIYTPDDLNELVKLAQQYRSDVETRISILEDDMRQGGVALDESAAQGIEEEINHWRNTLEQIDKTIEDYGKKPIKKFVVLRKEVHVQPVYIQAENATEALQQVKEGEGDYEESEMYYERSLETDCWQVEESIRKGKKK